MSNSVLTIIKKIKELDETKIIRKNLGDASFKDFQPLWDEVKSKIYFIEKFYNTINTNTNNQVNSHLNAIENQLTTLIGYSDSQFINQKLNIKNAVEKHLDSIRNYWPQYAIAAIEDLGLLTNTGVKEQFNYLISELNEAKGNALIEIKELYERAIEEAKKKAEEIESSARKTAENVSVKEAQKQFTDAATHNFLQIKIWGIITVVLITVFICFIIYLLNGVDLPTVWNWSFVYLSILRIGILGLISTIIGFGLKMLKANLHMHQHNLHRKRLANSMAAFAESAMTNEQRDLILSQLVESVSNFGTSGMINKESDKGGISIDSITKTVSTLNGKE